MEFIKQTEEKEPEQHELKQLLNQLSVPKNKLIDLLDKSSKLSVQEINDTVPAENLYLRMAALKYQKFKNVINGLDTNTLSQFLMELFNDRDSIINHHLLSGDEKFIASTLNEVERNSIIDLLKENGLDFNHLLENKIYLINRADNGVDGEHNKETLKNIYLTKTDIKDIDRLAKYYEIFKVPKDVELVKFFEKFTSSNQEAYWSDMKTRERFVNIMANNGNHILWKYEKELKELLLQIEFEK